MRQIKINNIIAWLLIAAIILFVQYLMVKIPYLAIVETWRQGDVASVARNFATESMNIFFPRVDARGALTGICGMEFPLYNFIVALIYKMSGFVWIGFAKLLSALCSWIAVYFLYKFAKNDPVVGSKINAKLFVLVSFSIPFLYLYSCAVMPEMLALALGSAGLFYFSCYTHARSKLQYLILASALFSLSMLVRPYYAFFGFVMLVDCLGNLRRSSKNSALVAVFGVLSLLPFVAWYHFWVPYLNNKYGLGYYFYMGTPMVANFHLIFSTFAQFFYQILREFFVYVYVIFFLVGIYLRLKIKKVSFLDSLQQPFFQVMYIAFLAFCILPFIACEQATHFHYLGAVFPVAALVTSFAMSEILERTSKKFLLIALYCLLFLASYAICALRATHLYHSDRDALLLLKQKNSLLSGVSDSTLVILDMNPDRSYMYLLGRKGWVLQLSENPQERQKELIEMKNAGAQYLITGPKWQGESQTEFTIEKI